MADCPANCGGLEDAPAQAHDRVRVLLPLPLPAPLDYRVPDGEVAPAPGQFVRVTLGPRQLIGVVWEGDGEDVAGRAAASRSPRCCRRRRCRRNCATSSSGSPRYTLAPPGMVLSMAMRSVAALLPPAPRRVCAITEAGLAVLAESPQKRLTPGRRRVLEILRDGPAASIAETAREAGVGAAVVRGLIAAGLAAEHLAAGAAAPYRAARLADARAETVAGSGESGQETRRAGRERRVPCHRARWGHRLGQDRDLFRGDRRGARRAAGRSWCCCPKSRCRRNGWSASAGVSVRARSSGIPISRQTQRRDAWRAVAAGRARVVVGARSALFLPFSELGLIVVDEEHDLSYKQEDGVCYQARDMAVLRASLAQIPIVLVSATPSLETVVNVSRGRYDRVHLPRAARRGRACPRSI